MKKLCVCEYCLQAIRSRGEKFRSMPIYVDESDPEESKCGWCEESGNDTLYEISFR